MSKDHKRLKIEKTTPGYWKVTLNNPPINLFDPEMFAELRFLMDQIEEDKVIKVVVFDSADPNYFISHYDIARGDVVPDLPGSAPFSEWPAFVTRLAQSRVISIAKVRGRARGHGSELALACDVRFASREKAIFAQIEVGCAVVPGGGATEWLTVLAGRSGAPQQRWQARPPHYLHASYPGGPEVYGSHHAKTSAYKVKQYDSVGFQL